tara:strand:+ start:365 stop:1033 length:669 start_codon:yes stop_codon:yes gene_type:complete
MMEKRDIIRALRKRLRELFPNMQSFIDDGTITKSDWIFFGRIIYHLMNCFIVSPEKAIRRSKAQLNKVLRFYEKEVRVRKLALKSDLFLKDNNIDVEGLQAQLWSFKENLDYWALRHASTDLCFEYEIHLYLYYKWMDNYEFDDYYQRELLMSLMNLCGYYGTRYFSLERLESEKEVLMSEIRMGSELLRILDYATEMGSGDETVPGSDIEVLINEADAHLN